MDADGGNVQRLVGGGGRFLEPDRAGTPGIDTHPRFAPDGEWVAFMSENGGMGDECLLTDDPQPYGDTRAVPVRGGEAVRLTDDRWEDGLPQWGTRSAAGCGNSPTARPGTPPDGSGPEARA